MGCCFLSFTNKRKDAQQNTIHKAPLSQCDLLAVAAAVINLHVTQRSQ